MSEIRFRCLSCAQRISADEATAGKQVLCPQCQTMCLVPRPGPVGELLSVDMRFRCPACGKKIAVDCCHAGEAAQCPACRANLTIPGLPAELGRRSAPPPSSPASVLSREEVSFLTSE